MALRDETDRPGGSAPGTLDRRSFLGMGLRTAGGAALLATAPSALSACTSTSSSSGSGSGAPRRGGSLTIGISAETNGLDPTISQFTSPAVFYARAVFDPLTAAAADGSVQPYLAQSVTPNADYTVWTIGLRPGVTFHDGTPLDADALVYYLDHVLAGTYALFLGPITSISKVDDMTVNVNLNEPWVSFPAYLTGEVGVSQFGYVAAPSMLRNPNGASSPVGTGPFVFKEWKPGDHFSVTRNPHYWRSGLPYLDSVEFRPIVDDTARQQSLLSGTIGMLQTNNTESIVLLRGESSVHMIDNLSKVYGEPDQNFIMLNTQRAPLDDIRIRRALALATDQKKVIEVTQNGIVPPATGPFQPGSPYYSDTGYPSYDPAQARSLVSEYAREGKPVSFPMVTTNSATYQSQLELLQSMWRQVGISTSIQVLDETKLISNMLVGAYSAQSQQQFGVADPDLNYNFWSTRTVAPLGTLAVNFARNSDPQIQAALDLGRTHADLPTRAGAYQSVARRFAVDLPYIWLGRVAGAVAAQGNVQGFQNPTFPNGALLAPLNQADAWFSEVYLA
jgi:peptide/nickel transport system substrate-binding protein